MFCNKGTTYYDFEIKYLRKLNVKLYQFKERVLLSKNYRSILSNGGGLIEEFGDNLTNIISGRNVFNSSLEINSFAKYCNPINNPSVILKKIYYRSVIIII